MSTFWEYKTKEWRRLIGSPKLQVTFHKRATKYRALLRKMTYKDKGSYESSPPCIYVSTVWECLPFENIYKSTFGECVPFVNTKLECLPFEKLYQCWLLRMSTFWELLPVSTSLPFWESLPFENIWKATFWECFFFFENIYKSTFWECLPFENIWKSTFWEYLPFEKIHKSTFWECVPFVKLYKLYYRHG